MQKDVGMACQKCANKVGMMHESKGQYIGKAPSLHLFTLELDSTLESTLESSAKTYHPYIILHF